MSASFNHRRRVEFRDTDAAGIVHFSNFFVYMEQAEHEFLRHLGLGVVHEIDGQTYSWPRVHATCNYRLAIRFEDWIDVELTVERIGSSSVTYGFQFHREGQRIADGKITAVCCLFGEDGQPASVEIPEKFVKALKNFRDG